MEIDTEQLKLEKDALDQSLALNKVVVSLLEERKKEMRHIWMVLLTICIIFAIAISVFAYFNYTDKQMLMEQLENTRVDFMEYLQQKQRLKQQLHNEWESETKECYEKAAKELLDAGYMADYNKVNCLIEDVDMELKHIDRLIICLKSVAYNDVYVATIQDELHEKYRAMTKEIGVDIC